MPKSYTATIEKLQRGLNMRGCRLLLTKKQIFSDKYHATLYVYLISQSAWDNEKMRYRVQELFKCNNQVQVVLFFRNLMYFLDSKEIPKSPIPTFEVRWQEFLEKRIFVLPEDNKLKEE